MASLDQKQRVDGEIVAHIYRLTPTGLVATVVNSLILALILRSVVSKSTLTVWLSAVLFLSLLRYILCRRYRRDPRKVQHARRWSRLFLIGLSLSGILWGSTAVFLFPPQSVAHQVFIAFILAGMVAGVAGAFSPVVTAFPAFATPALMPLMLRCLVIGDEIHVAMSVMIALFAVLMSVSAKRMGQTNRKWVGLTEHFANKVEERTRELTEANDQLRQEIGQRKRVEESLRLSKQEWETTFNAISDWVSVIDVDSRIVRTNRVGEVFLGLPTHEIVGQPCYRLVHGTDRPIPACPFPKMLETGKEQTAEIQLPDSRWIRVKVDPVKNQAGMVIRAVHTVSDISEHKRAEEALRESEERFRAIAESAQDAIFCKDTNARYTFVNPKMERLLGHSASDILGRTARDLLSGEAASVIEKADRRTLSGSAVRGEQRLVLNGREYIFNVIQVPMRNSRKAITGLSGIARDITETKRMEAHLRQAQKMEAIAALAGGIAHQFNNALSSITMNIEMLEMDATANENIIRYSRFMKDAAYRMVHLTDQLLAYARGGKYRARTVSLSDFVRNSLPLVKHAIGPSVRLDTNLPADVWNVRADIIQIQMILSALLSNASEAMDGKGRVAISVDHKEVDESFAEKHPGMKPGRYVRLTVEDDGKGMSDETRRRVFEPFFTTKFEGRGLGMAAVYGIVKNHDGWISVESELGKGTTVCIYLPATEASLEETARPLPRIIQGTGTILIVEDDEMALEVTTTMLEKLGYRVLTASTGGEGADIAENFRGPIDLALLDLNLPDMKGKTTYSLLTKARPNLKVIICTGYSFEDSNQDILSWGVQGIVQKPFSISVLSEIIKDVLGKNSGNEARG